MAPFEKSIDNLLQKSENQRKRIVWIISGVTMVFVAIIWVLSLQQTAIRAQAFESQEAQDNDEQGRSISDILDEQAEYQQLLQEGAKVETGESGDQLPGNNIRVIPKDEVTSESTTPSSATDQEIQSATEGLDSTTINSLDSDPSTSVEQDAASILDEFQSGSEQ